MPTTDAASASALDWLLASDPAIRWQALRDLTEAPPHVVAAERARVANEGWAPRLLALQGADGQWRVGSKDPEWISLLALLLLLDMGLDPASPPARAAFEGVRDAATFHAQGDWHGRPLFDGEVEPCINGRIVAVGAAFGHDVDGIVERLLGEQMADGGWNCEAENGSVRGSFHTTIDVLDGLLAVREATSGRRDVAEAMDRAHEYLIERGMLRRRSTGEPIDPSFAEFAYPTGYRFDALRGLDHLRAAGVAPDRRLAEAVELVRSRRRADGRWSLDVERQDELVDARIRDLDFDMAERVGEPSRWITLHALRVLAWADGAA